MYKMFKKSSLVVIAALLLLSATGLTKAHASGSWSQKESAKSRAQRIIQQKQAMNKKISDFTKQNSDKSIYAALANIEKDINSGFGTTYDYYYNNYVTRPQNTIASLNNHLTKLKSYDVNDVSYDNVNNIYQSTSALYNGSPMEANGGTDYDDFFAERYLTGLKTNNYNLTDENGKVFDFSQQGIINFNKKMVQVGINAYNSNFDYDKSHLGDAYTGSVTVADLGSVKQNFDKYAKEALNESKRLSKLSNKASGNKINASTLLQNVKNVQGDLDFFTNHAGTAIEYQHGKWVATYSHYSHGADNKAIYNDGLLLHRMSSMLYNISKNEPKDKSSKKLTVKKHSKKKTNSKKKHTIKKHAAKKNHSKKKYVKKHAVKKAHSKKHITKKDHVKKQSHKKS